MTKLSQFFSQAKKAGSSILTILSQGNLSPIRYRILSVEKDEFDDYTALIQVINKKQTFKMKPELILADDKLTDYFSPRDIRSLTYLGYLGINSPKYKILAQRLSEQDEKLMFAIQEKGKKRAIVKSADEISQDEAFLKSLDQKDAHMIGFITATSHAAVEKKAKEQLIEAAQKEKLLQTQEERKV